MIGQENVGMKRRQEPVGIRERSVQLQAAVRSQFS
jgi:hypothetical protein